MDKKDEAIIHLLLQNSRLTTKEISAETDIPQTTIHNRIKLLIENRIIEKFTINLNRKKVNRSLVAYIHCTISYRTRTGEKISQIEVAKQIRRFPEVEEVAIVTGEIDLIVKVSMKDVDALNQFLITKLRDLEGVEKTITSVVLTEV